MSTPYVLKGWKTREWQKALELASAVDGNDPEMHLIGGTYVEVGRNAQGPYVEVNSGDANGRDLRVRRVYMKPKPSRTSKRKANVAPGAGEARYIVRFRDENRRVAYLKNSGAFTHAVAAAKQYKQKSAAEAVAERIAEDNHGVLTGVRVELVGRKANGKLRRTKAACSRRGRETRQGKSTAASHLATHCPPLGVRKGNDASPKVRVLSMKKQTRTIRGVGFNSYDVNLMVGNQFVTIEADAYRRPVLPESIRDGATREAILHAVQHYRSGR